MESNIMPIKIKKIPVSLIKSPNPTKLTAENLKLQLANIGLTCEETDIAKLKKHIQHGMNKLPPGKSYRYGILSPKTSVQARSDLLSNSGESLDFSDNTLIVKSINGSHEEYVLENNFGTYQVKKNALLNKNGPSKPGETGFLNELSSIVYPDNFTKLLAGRPGFNARSHLAPERVEEDTTLTTAQAVQDFFVNIASSISAETVGGMDKEDLTSIFYNRIQKLTDITKDYDQPDSIIITWVKNYNIETEEADAIGAVHCSWNLFIKNYQEKKRDFDRKTKLTINAHSATYDNADVLMSDYHFLFPQEK